MEKYVYLNNGFTTLDQAHISVLDRGFLFGDGIYETIPAYNQCLFSPENHLQRLQQSCDAINLKNPKTNEQWLQIFKELLNKNQSKHAAILCQVTRGVMPERQHIPTESTPTIFVASTEIQLKNIEDLSQGLSAITLPDIRWQYCHIKSTSLMANVIALQQAQQQDAQAAIFVRNGFITEECMRNVFIVKNNIIYTPLKDTSILPGVTRDVVIHLARDHGLTVNEANIGEEQLLQADEVFFTSSTKEIIPALKINQCQIGNGQAGPIWRQLITLYHQFIEHYHD